MHLPTGVVWREEPIPAAASVEEHRELEHRAGRSAAGAALEELGGRGRPIKADSIGAPLFPAGFSGSITHDTGLAAAIVADAASGFTAAGADLHRERTLHPRDAAYIAGDRELARALRATGPHAAHLVFALKEAVFKAHWTAGGDWLEFSDIELDVMAAGTARLRRPHAPGALLRWQRTPSRIRAAALLR